MEDLQKELQHTTRVKGKIMVETEDAYLFKVKRNQRLDDRPNSVWFPKVVVKQVKSKDTSGYPPISATLSVANEYVKILKELNKL